MMLRYCISRSRLYVVLMLVSIRLQRTIAVGRPDRIDGKRTRIYCVQSLPLVGSFRGFLGVKGQRGFCHHSCASSSEPALCQRAGGRTLEGLPQPLIHKSCVSGILIWLPNTSAPTPRYPLDHSYCNTGRTLHAWNNPIRYCAPGDFSVLNSSRENNVVVQDTKAYIMPLF